MPKSVKNNVPEQHVLSSINDMCTVLHMSGFKYRLAEVVDDPTWLTLTMPEQLRDLLSAELSKREINAIARLRRNSNLPHELLHATYNELYDSHERKLDPKLLTLIKEGSWMLKEAPADLVLSGACGVGKSYLAACCVNFMVDRRNSAYFIRAGRLLTDLHLHRLNNTIEKRKQELKKIGLLVLDDFLIDDVNEADCADLLDIINDRNRLKPTIYTSQFKIEGWLDRLGNTPLSQAVLDRINHSSFKLHIEGPSQRPTVSL